MQDLVDEDEEKAIAERRAIAIAQRKMAWSPTVALTLAAERLAGRDLHSALAFRRAVVDSVAERADWVVERAWRDSPLSLEDFESLAAPVPTVVLTQPASVTPHLTVLLAWTVVAWAVGVVRVRRREIDV